MACTRWCALVHLIRFNMNFFLFLTFAGACISVIILFFSTVLSVSAPQQAAGAALALAVTVIPYAMMRVVHIARQLREEKERHTALMNTLAKLESSLREPRN